MTDYEVEDINTWRLRKIGNDGWGRDSRATWVATAPGCPNGYHSFSRCKCKAFKTAPQAREFILESNRALNR